MLGFKFIFLRNLCRLIASMGLLLTVTLGTGQAWAVTGSIADQPNSETYIQNFFGHTYCRVDFNVTVTGTDDDGAGFDNFDVTWTDANGLTQPSFVARNPIQPGTPRINVGDTQTIALRADIHRTPLTQPMTMTLLDGTPIDSVTWDLTVCDSANTSPTAIAGADQSMIAVGSTVTLNGSQSSDPDGDAITYQWMQTVGPTVVLSDPTSASPTFTAPADAGTLRFQLVVNDGTVDSTADSVTVTTTVQGRLDIVLSATYPITGASFDALTCELDNTFVIGFRADTVGATNDGSGDNWIIEWYDFFGNFTGTTQGTAPIGVDQDTSLNPYWTGPDFINGTQGMWRNPHTYRVYDADSSFNKLSLVATHAPNIQNSNGAAWRQCWENLGSINTAPVADAGADQSVNDGDIVTLNGTGSSDADGDNLTYLWTQAGGNPVTLSNNASANPTFTAPASVDGLFSQVIFNLTVNDGQANSTVDPVLIIIAPTLATGRIVDGSTSLSATITQCFARGTADFSGTTADALAGGASPVNVDFFSVYQELSDGSETFVLSRFAGVGETVQQRYQAEITDPDAIFNLYDDTAGRQSSRLLDSFSYSERDFINAGGACANLVNMAPVADAGPDQTELRPDEVVTLDGTGSSDADGDPLTYIWTQVSGPTVTLDDATSVTPTFTIPLTAVDTAVVFELVVNDSLEDSAADQVSFIAVNAAPIANAGADQTDPRPNDVVTLDGSGSSDPDGDNLTYVWTQVSGPTVELDDAKSATPTFTIPLDAVATAIIFELVVNDGFVSSAPDQVSIMAVNEAPIADAGEDQADPRPNSLVTLDGSGSSDADGDTLTYLWTQISGPTVTLNDATAVSPTFTIPVDAVATPIVFQLVVNDGFEGSDPDTVTISAKNEAPIAEAGQDQADVIPGNVVTLDGTASSDADGDVLTYMWTQVSGPIVSLNDPASATPSFSAPGGTNGEPIILQLVVNDSYVDSAPDTVSITIQDNVAVTKQAIKNFMTARNSLILAHQPDLQRRIDRLNGTNKQTAISTVDGIPLPGSSKLPFQLAANGPNIQLSGNYSGKRKDGKMGTFDIWGEAYLSEFEIDGRSGDFDIFYGGADYLISKDMLVGVMAQLDEIDYDSSVTSGVLKGSGWMVGPYVSAKLSDILYVDGRIAYGQSDNTISPFGTYTDEFKTTRWLLSGTVTGEFPLGENLTIRPEGSLQYISETQNDYTDSLGSRISSQKDNQGQLSFGPRVHYQNDLGKGWMFRPYVEAAGVYNFGDNVESVLGTNTRLRMEAGLELYNVSGFRFGGAYFTDGIGASSYGTDGWRLIIGYTPTGG